ncbi:MAG: glycosyltransferase family 4 protein, partial [Gammaproteobacteria bacterium]|nr:glycosyltransferase family 4 protein [Gammaproteobacteria bacterium]
KILDVPNARSSHNKLMPTGGGAAIVFSFFLGIFSLWGLGYIETSILIALIGSGGAVAGIGLWDDYDGIPRKWRLLVHFVAAIWVLFWFGSISFLDISLVSYSLVGLGNILVLFFLVWCLNVFNFMDGIDGLAASEALFVSICAAFLASLSGSDVHVYILLILAVVTMGFLVLNWPPARIFMGDVGSGFLGIMLGTMAYATIANGIIPVWSWLILFGVFMADASITLTRRIFRGERWYNAHRSHAYQHAAQYFKSHRRVTVCIIMINIFWLFPCALYAAINPQWGILMAAIAYLPLVFIVFRFRAGCN